MEFALPATGLLTIILAKMRCLWKGPCLSCAYNDPHITLSTAEPEAEEWSPEDSQKTLPPPPIPMHRVLDLRRAGKIKR